MCTDGGEECKITPPRLNKIQIFTHASYVTGNRGPPMLQILKQLLYVQAGAYERVTCVPSKYKFKHGTGHGYLCMYMAVSISNRRALSVFGKYCT